MDGGLPGEGIGALEAGAGVPDVVAGAPDNGAGLPGGNCVFGTGLEGAAGGATAAGAAAGVGAAGWGIGAAGDVSTTSPTTVIFEPQTGQSTCRPIMSGSAARRWPHLKQENFMAISR